MNTTLRRLALGVAALATAATFAPFLDVLPAGAAGTPAGSASVSPTSGSKSTAFSITLPSGAACPGDSGNDGYRVQTYMVPASVDPSTLQFDANGPTPQGTGASFRQPLYDTNGSPIVDYQTANASPAPGPGPILPLPQANYNVFTAGDIPAGVYNIGVACTLGPAGATQMKSFWNLQKTFTSANGDWSFGAVPSAPTLTAVSAAPTSCTATYSSPAATPSATTYTVRATNGATTVTGTGTSTSGTVSGLTTGTTYQMTVTQANSVGTSSPSNAIACTPSISYAAPVLSASPQTGAVRLDWTAPQDAATYPVTDYTVDVSPAVAGYPKAVSGLTDTVPGTAGTVYTFTVTPNRANGTSAATSNTVQASPLAAQVIVQDVTVTRPVGALVFTQVCGVNGPIAAENASTGFPGGLPAVGGVGTLDADTGRRSSGSAPTTGASPGGAADPVFAQYPYPENADGTANPTYPTHCGLSLGNAKFVTKGNGAGKFFAATGVLSQVTIVDTRDSDPGWTANGTMSEFSAGPDVSQRFSGSQLGWTPVMTDDTDQFTDSSGATYDQVVTAGGSVDPNTLDSSCSPNTPGNLAGSPTRCLAKGATLATSVATKGLGIGVLDARVKLLIPVTKKAGVYTGTLTLSAI